MPDWTKSMAQSFEFYVVDPGTWKDTIPLKTVKSCTVVRDSDLETLGSATFEVGEPIGEQYVRVYLVTEQAGLTEKHPLGTFLVQTTPTGFDGKVRTVSVDAYTPLLELKENPPAIGYSINKGENIMDMAYMLTREHTRAPVVKPSSTSVLYDNFVAEPDETWLSYNKSLIANAQYKYDLDELGRVLFAPDQNTASLQPVWTYSDDNSSILCPDITMDHDLFGIPNVVEVVYSTGSTTYYARVVNDDENSPTSTVNRGREIVHRDTDPDILGNPTEKEIQEYAKKLLRELSTLEYTITYTHGYAPVRRGDCVRLNYERAGLNNVKAKVIYQSIQCSTGCLVTEKAVFTKALWG